MYRFAAISTAFCNKLYIYIYDIYTHCKPYYIANCVCMMQNI